MQVKKKNGEITDFNQKKIRVSVSKAYNSVYNLNSENVPQKLKRRKTSEAEKAVLEIFREIVCNNTDIVTAEYIDDVVAFTLMDFDKAVAKAYILYGYVESGERVIK